MTYPFGIPGLRASEDSIPPARFIEISGDMTVEIADTNSTILGVSRLQSRAYNDNDAADTGELAPIATVEGTMVTIECGGNVAAGNYLKSDSVGRGVAAATTGTVVQNIGARALEGGVVGEQIKAVIVNKAVRPALS